jgi:hypothetical protein
MKMTPRHRVDTDADAFAGGFIVGGLFMLLLHIGIAALRAGL